MFYKNINYFFSLIILVVTGAQCGITVNNKDIHTIAKPGQMLTYTAKSSDTNVAFRFNNNNLSIGSAILKKPKEVNNTLDELQNHQQQNSSPWNIIDINAEDSLKMHAMYFTKKENLILKGGNLMNLESCILQAPEIYLKTNNLKSKACFASNSQYVQLESSSENALFKIIRFTFSEKPLLPCMMQGNINLVTGEMSENFIVTGATTIDFILNDSVFQNNPVISSNTSPQKETLEVLSTTAKPIQKLDPSAAEIQKNNNNQATKNPQKTISKKGIFTRIQEIITWNRNITAGLLTFASIVSLYTWYNR